MSMESAMAVLEKAAIPAETKAGVNPDSAEVVKDKATDAIKDINFNIKLDGLSNPSEKETKSEESTQAPTEQKAEEASKEDKPDLKPEEDKKDERMSQRFAVLAKKEKDLYRNAQALKTKETQLGERERAVENFEKFKAQAKTNPMLALREIGVTYDDLTKYVLSGKMPQGDSAEVEAVKEELAALRAELSERQKAEEEKQEKLNAQQVQEKVAAFQQEISDYVKSNADRFELTDLYGASQVVYQAIENHFNETGRIMSIEEGCEIVEKYYEELAEKTLSAKKLAQKVAPQKQVPTAQPRTLNNEMTSSAPSFLPAKTEQDRMRRALARLSQG